MNLTQIGWNATFQKAFDEIKQETWLPARVCSQDVQSYVLMSELGTYTGLISGKFRYLASKSRELPTVGDWVAAEILQDDNKAKIHTILPRETLFSRKTPGSTIQEQVLASNIDTVFIVLGLDNDFNLRRIERYIAVAWNSGAQPVVVLNKLDLLAEEHKEEIYNRVQSVAVGVPIHFISMSRMSGLSEIKAYFSVGKTIALLGSSGVGKSTLTNYLLETSQQKTQEVREGDSKGRHTTSRRQLFILPTGGLIIDTPGMRELQLWLDEDELESSFQDIKQVASKCRYKNCIHDVMQGLDCSIQRAISQGDLDPKRLENYNKMLREIQGIKSRQQEGRWRSREEDRKFGKERHNLLKHDRH